LISRIYLSKSAKKDLDKLPLHVVNKFIFWVRSVETSSLEVVRTHSGFHDEPLKGSRSATRSIRLSRSYRAFYRIINIENIPVVRVEEINKHDY
jgi:proteic killer suppression protein